MSRQKHKCCNCHQQINDVQEIVDPTQTVVKVRTNTRTIRRIHPIEIINVNRTIVRNENFYPVTQRNVNEVVEEDFNCGSDVNNPNCQSISGDFGNTNNFGTSGNGGTTGNFGGTGNGDNFGLFGDSGLFRL